MIKLVSNQTLVKRLFSLKATDYTFGGFEDDLVLLFSEIIFLLLSCYSLLLLKKRNTQTKCVFLLLLSAELVVYTSAPAMVSLWLPVFMTL